MRDVSKENVEELAERFFLTVRQKDGCKYKVKAQHSIKYGLQLYLNPRPGKGVAEFALPSCFSEI